MVLTNELQLLCQKEECIAFYFNSSIVCPLNGVKIEEMHVVSWDKVPGPPCWRRLPSAQLTAVSTRAGLAWRDWLWCVVGHEWRVWWPLFTYFIFETMLVAFAYWRIFTRWFQIWPPKIKFRKKTFARKCPMKFSNNGRNSTFFVP